MTIYQSAIRSIDEKRVGNNTVYLREEQLTDGSLVYNIHIRDAYDYQVELYPSAYDDARALFDALSKYGA